MSYQTYYEVATPAFMDIHGHSWRFIFPMARSCLDTRPSQDITEKARS